MQYENFQRLVDEGIIDKGDGLNDKQKQQLESLSEQEIQALINIRQKLDEFEWPIVTVIKPQMF